MRDDGSVTTLTNWSGNYTYRAPRLHRPDSVEQLQEIVAGAERVKALGSRHCFNDIADTSGDLVDMSGLPDDVAVDGTTVTVSAGMKYGTLASALQEHSLALANLASLPHISIAGAVATGTHGSGVGNQGLAAAVAAMEIVQGDGELRRVARGDDDFAGAVVSLGAIGVIVRMTLDVVPTFEVRQDVFENLLWAELEDNFADVVSGAYSVSLFTDYLGDGVSQVWCKSRIDSPATPSAAFDDDGRVRSSFFGATPATVERHPLPGLGGEVCTPQLGVPGAWYERLPHFQLAFTPSNGEELQTEYLVPSEQALEVIAVLRELAPRIAPLLQVSEIRTVAPDDLWLSPAYQRDSVAFHFTWVRDQPAVEVLLREVEAAISAFDPRPHWGKLFAADSAALEVAYPELPRFRRLAQRLDPDGVFRNAYLDRYVYPV
jgi:xylitol oxidase